MQTKKVKFISVSIKNRDELKKKYQCSQTAIYNALAYRTSCKRAESIRRDAIDNFGGVVCSRLIFN